MHGLRLGVIGVMAFATAGWPAAAQRPSAGDTSLRAELRLDARQAAAMAGLYTQYARVRLDEEFRMAAPNDALRAGRTLEGFDSPQDTYNRKLIADAERNIENAFARSRRDALAALTPEQSRQLALFSRNRQRRPADGIGQLLLIQPRDVWRAPIEDATARRLLTARAYTTRSRSAYNYADSGATFRSYGYGLPESDLFDRAPLGLAAR